MLADIRILHSSDVYRITEYRCHCDVCSVSEREYSDAFCISFITKGFFEYQVYRRNNEVYAGRLHLSKPGYEHTTRHIDNQPDITNVLEFTAAFFEEIKLNYPEAGWFLNNNDIHAIVMQCSPKLELMRHHLAQLLAAKRKNSLQIDELVFSMLDNIMGVAGNIPELPQLPDSLKQYHLTTIEAAKEYILQHFREDISLQQLAKHCHVSPFHFSRIFKSMLHVPPHKYLNEIRLHHASVLLRTTNRPVSDIAFECGFGSVEHFAMAYKKMFGVSSSGYRRQMA
jgi:AraC family transcriptional regulator